MTTTQPQTRAEAMAPRHERRRLFMGAGILTVSVLGLSSVATGAYFTDSQTIGANTFTTGTVKLATNPTTAAITMANMAPGDVVTAPITVTNNGSLSLRYAVVSTSDVTDNNVLAAQLKLTIKTGLTAANCTTANFTAGGTVATPQGVLGSTTGTKLIGDSLQGAQAGDRVLAAGGAEVLCAQVTLPTTTDNTFQNKTTTAVFTFNAEQTVNNA